MSLRVQLRRPDPSHPWGFRIAGGRDCGAPVSVRKVNPNMLAGRHGLAVGDVLIDIGGDSTAGMTHQQAQQAIIRCGNELDIELLRGVSAAHAAAAYVAPRSPTSNYSVPATYQSSAHNSPAPYRQPGPFNAPHKAPARPTPAAYNAPGPFNAPHKTAARPAPAVYNAPGPYNAPHKAPAAYSSPAAYKEPAQPSPGVYRSNRGLQLSENMAPTMSGGGAAPWRSPHASTSSMNTSKNSPISPKQPSAMNRLEQTMTAPGKPLPMGYNPRQSGQAPAAPGGTRRGQSARHQAGSRGPMDRDPICDCCHSLIRGPFIVALEKCYCPEHFRCSQCGIRMEDCGFVEEAGQLYCESDFARFLAPRCARCGLPVVERIVNALRQSWHPACFTCHACKKQLAGSEPGPGEATFRIGDDNQPYCEEDWTKLFQAKCSGCGYSIDEMDQFIEALGSIYHSSCFCCAACKCSLDGKPFVPRNGKAFCKAHARAAAIY